MAGNKTHEQELRIIEKKEKTANAGDDFDERKDLERSKEAREAFRKGQSLSKPADLTDPDDRSMIEGENQESRHHNRSDSE